MSVWLVLVYALAVARITGLVTDDELTDPIRRRVLRRLFDRGRFRLALATLVTCQWCVSIWVAAVAVALVWSLGAETPWLMWPAIGLAWSQVTGMLSKLGR